MKTMNLWKRAAILAAVAMATVMNVSAQEQGDKAIGGHLVYNTGDFVDVFGIGVIGQYNITNPIRLEGSLTYCFPKNSCNVWDISANGHYLFPISDDFTLYPLAGIGLLGRKAGDYSDTSFGLNLGGGLDYKLTDVLTGSVQLKDMIVDGGDRIVLSVGITYKF